MANEIKDKYSAAAALTITLASLASSTAGVGRQSTIVDNSTNRYQKIKLYCQIKLGTSPSGSSGVYVFSIRGDQHATPYRTDGAGASDAALTVLNAPLLGVMRDLASPATGDVLYGEFELLTPGPEWGICIVHDTAVALNSTGGNHFCHWIGVDPEVI
jgi:hypothetical protein